MPQPDPAEPIRPGELGSFVLNRLDDWEQSALDGGDADALGQIDALRLQAGLLISAAHMPAGPDNTARDICLLALRALAMIWKDHPGFRAEWTVPLQARSVGPA